ncbi:hypothetical protein ST47_g7394 [Ascochyta rabiei]|uniref:LYC1 C-terminal domain-containing protein n=1 Tax=Didymella rabiei TaxID=5454 RepID=A0A163AWD1_DIDRA|nr:hypothetical protein ST47_g7394 [Ascochyta rabiei]
MTGGTSSRYFVEEQKHVHARSSPHSTSQKAPYPIQRVKGPVDPAPAFLPSLVRRDGHRSSAFHLQDHAQRPAHERRAGKGVCKRKGYCITSVVTALPYRGHGLVSTLLQSDGSSETTISVLYSCTPHFCGKLGWTAMTRTPTWVYDRCWTQIWTDYVREVFKREAQRTKAGIEKNTLIVLPTATLVDYQRASSDYVGDVILLSAFREAKDWDFTRVATWDTSPEVRGALEMLAQVSVFKTTMREIAREKRISVRWRNYEKEMGCTAMSNEAYAWNSRDWFKSGLSADRHTVHLTTVLDGKPRKHVATREHRVLDTHIESQVMLFPSGSDRIERADRPGIDTKPQPQEQLRRTYTGLC